MKPIIAATILALASGCGYSHIASTTTTFKQLTPLLAASPNDVQSGPLVLKITRHLDTVLNGPDIEEDQVLLLEVRNFRLNQKLLIPSDNVKPQFTVTRSGPRSEGRAFSGYLIVRRISAKQVNVSLHLVVTANTANGSYIQTAKFRGEHEFFLEPGND
jgi:hypothetical protein